jgi:hypothetical protein
MDAIEAMYASWAAGTDAGGDHWGDVTGEPGGLDYLEVEANGVPAMWLSPHDADQDRVIVARAQLEGYMAAWEAADAPAFGRLLRPDAAIEPVGSRVWFDGLDTCLAFATPFMGAPGDWRMVPAVVNDQPAAASWFHGAPFGVAVLTPTPSGIAAITLFADPALTVPYD